MSAPQSVVFAEAGRLLYGAEWQSAVARAFDLNLRTVQRIAAAATEDKAYRVPTGVLREMASMLLEHATECNRLADGILAQDFPPVAAD